MSQKDIGNKIPIYKLKAGKEVENYYDEWTIENKYDKDMVDWKYSGPQETVELFKKYVLKKDIKILDAGCGTGLVGIELKKNNFNNIDGADFSQKMLNLVPENVYKNLFKIDLNQKVQIKDRSSRHRCRWFLLLRKVPLRSLLRIAHRALQPSR